MTLGTGRSKSAGFDDVERFYSGTVCWVLDFSNDGVHLETPLAQTAADTEPVKSSPLAASPAVPAVLAVAVAAPVASAAAPARLLRRPRS